MSGNLAASDRRSARTRQAIVDAYGELVLGSRRGEIKVTDIVSRANVGRSTFYEHYDGADAVFLEAVAPALALIAAALTGRADPASLEGLLAHFWENRQRARDMLTGRLGDRVLRRLTDLIEERLGNDACEPILPPRLLALQLASSVLGPITAWLTAEAPCDAGRLATGLCAGAAGLRAGTGPESRKTP